MNIDGVTTGIVLDHIDAGKSLAIYNLLRLDKLDCSIAIIQNAKSGKYGKKDIIKIDQIIDLDFDLIGFVDPNITVNIIKDSKLHSKKHMSCQKDLQMLFSVRILAALPRLREELNIDSVLMTLKITYIDANIVILFIVAVSSFNGIKIVFYLFRKIYRQCICPPRWITCGEVFCANLYRIRRVVLQN